MFVRPILVLQGAVCRSSIEHFEGQEILFSDSAARLQEQMERVDEALEIFNSIAEKAKFRKLTREQVCESLSSDVDQKTSRLLLIARGVMLGSFGEPADLRETSILAARQ